MGPELLALAARLHEAQALAMKDKSYRATPIGGEVGRFLRGMKWGSASENTLLSYETTLARLALDFAHKELAELTLENLVDFLDDHWGESSPNTRRQRLAVIKSFFRWAKTRGLAEHPVMDVQPPKKVDVSRNSYTPDVIDQLREAQPTLGEQIVVQLAGRLGLRRNEIRLIQIRDFDLGRGTVKVHAKGGHVHTVPLGFPSLKADLETHLVGRGPDEYLLHPKKDTRKPMSPVGVHDWFKRALRRAGLSESIKLHEMRHSAADNLWRETGNIVLAQQLLRHRSPQTTIEYLHPSMEDLSEALAAMEGERGE